MKDGSGSLGWVFDAEERDGGTFVLIGSGEGGGREAGVEGMSCHSRWNRRGERRKAGKGERGKRTVLSQRQLELCLRCNRYPKGECIGHPSRLLESSNESKQRMATHTLSASYL